MAVEVRAQVWAKTDGHCWYCGKKMNPWHDFTIEHMDPRSQGGCDELGNLIPACQSCNSRKHTKTVEEYRTYLHEKRMVKFWGEHNAQQLMTIAAVVVKEEEQEESYWPSLEKYQEIIEACLVLGSHIESNVSMTLIALVNDGFEWNDDGTCEGWFDIEKLSQKTGLNPFATLSHINALLECGFLTMSWRTGFCDSHEFTLYLEALLVCTHQIRQKQRMLNNDGFGKPL